VTGPAGEARRPDPTPEEGSPGAVSAYRGPLQGLYDLAQLLGGESPESRRFLRGLAIGALVGAAMAGSSFVRRRRRTSSGGEAPGGARDRAPAADAGDAGPRKDA
jgi:hypothetical protein